eukprot:CAMPEP_0201555070 /NCGR_PEP_ID=MMETSP0173_2-20130828/46319_1 /ASSEMBLY_ACC=CAM_ASM_000268 /TAXON_ID=218659 /ORGANISM="Vexillifera sp., Strain DIVA3 564/2" /LENGTH=319 /DNA_ID=CAMNT_0047966673 /DNA_START=222 /DNA_END=1178 /DNA_ORIENTATION=+
MVAWWMIFGHFKGIPGANIDRLKLVDQYVSGYRPSTTLQGDSDGLVEMIKRNAYYGREKKSRKKKRLSGQRQRMRNRQPTGSPERPKFMKTSGSVIGSSASTRVSTQRARSQTLKSSDTTPSVFVATSPQAESARAKAYGGSTSKPFTDFQLDALKALIALIEQCWQHHASERPSFTQVYRTITQIQHKFMPLFVNANIVNLCPLVSEPEIDGSALLGAMTQPSSSDQTIRAIPSNPFDQEKRREECSQQLAKNYKSRVVRSVSPSADNWTAKALPSEGDQLRTASTELVSLAKKSGAAGFWQFVDDNGASESSRRRSV